MILNSLQFREGTLLLLQNKSWKKKWVVVKGGVLFVYETKGSQQRDIKFPLYKCIIEEYQPEEMPEAFQITNREETLILRATDVEDMHQWLNAVQNQKIKIEEVIDCITIE